VISEGVTLFPGVYVGEGSIIGKGSILYSNVTVREGVRIGERVIIHAGAVIGADGFGYATDGGKHHKIPQIGGVIIEDDVEVGANTTIDRGALGNTVVKRGAKIDNLVMIAHNVVVGEDSILCAHVGISGSTELGHHVVLAGQVGTVGHIKIGDGVMVGAKSGVSNDLESGKPYSGIPAMPHKEWLKLQAILHRLPEIKKQVGDLVKKVAALENNKGNPGGE
jgi:UDP-3-O-[3-hydroxymyristoyl] glucosamine N-acyltransferase